MASPDPPKKSMGLIIVVIVLIVLLAGASYYSYSFNSTNADLNSQIAAKNNQISQLNSQMASQSTQISQLQSQVQGLNQTKNNLQAQVAHLQAQISSLQSSNSQLQGQVATLQAQVSTLQAQITSLQSTISQLQAATIIGAFTAKTTCPLFGSCYYTIDGAYANVGTITATSATVSFTFYSGAGLTGQTLCTTSYVIGSVGGRSIANIPELTCSSSSSTAAQSFTWTFSYS